MKQFDKKAERRVGISLLASIPLLFFVLWKQNGKIEMTEITIAIITLSMVVGIILFTKWYANKE